MAVGSAFDALVKQHLTGTDFSNQVDANGEDPGRAWDIGGQVFRWYKDVGALGYLETLLNGCNLVCEREIRGSIQVAGLLDIPLMGKPDLYTYRGETLYILDWKVNGILSKASPVAGYVDSFPGRVAHKSAKPSRRGHMIVGSEVIPKWSDQLGTYDLMLRGDRGAGSPDAGHSVHCIHQLTKSGTGNLKCTLYGYLWDPAGPEAADLEIRYRRCWNSILNLDWWGAETYARVQAMAIERGCDHDMPTASERLPWSFA
jgi:hypothetical protein